MPLADGAGTVRVIAGKFHDTRGPAQTFTPVDLWDLQLKAGGSVNLPVPDGYTTILVVQHGDVTINGAQQAAGVELVLFDRAGEGISLHADKDARALLLAGQPLNEPVVGQGPFVMNTSEQIRQAMTDFQAGRMGRLE